MKNKNQIVISDFKLLTIVCLYYFYKLNWMILNL